MIESAAVDRVLDLYIPSIQDHLKNGLHRPFVLAISGLQGAGKSTWAKQITDTLNDKHNLRTRTISLDDFYYGHKTLSSIRQSHIDNGLLRTRGQPGTHDERLALNFFNSLNDNFSHEPIVFPSFDKGLFKGDGDRVPEHQWEVVPRKPSLEVIVFEGWCVGFQPLPDELLKSKLAASKIYNAKPATTESGLDLTINTLSTHRVEHLQTINNNLRRYCSTFMGPSHFDGLLHLSTDDLRTVYNWRLDQEHVLIESCGSGMTDQELIRFVQGYMPAYELYLDRLSNEFFFPSTSSNIHAQVVLNRAREVVEVKKID